MVEIWKDIEGYPYEVSSEGRVRSLKTGRIMQPWVLRTGYLQVGLTLNGNRKRFLVHRLVASAFIENTEGKDFVNHINSRKDDNTVGNLEWVTKSENQIHYHENNVHVRRTYSTEFREEVANYPAGLLETHREYNVPVTTIYSWREAG